MEKNGMGRPDYKALLDKTYELEGLLLRALDTGDVPHRLRELIDVKVKAIGAWGRSGHNHADAGRAPRKETKVAEKPKETSTHHEPVKENVAFNAFYALEDDDDVYTAPKEERRKQPVQPRPLPVFSLNDRFLFIREVFGGDSAAFGRALEKLRDFDNYEDAEDYLVNEFDLDAENEITAGFLETIENHYR